MRSLLLDIYNGLNNVYSGWIAWNLFLAFIPMLLSFRLFRSTVISPRQFQLAWLLTGAIGFIGISARLHRIKSSLSGSWNVLQMGGAKVMVQLAWLGLVVAVVLVTSVWFSRQTTLSKSGRWLLGLAIFIAFLPNAPYVLTDVIHLIRGTSYGEIRVWVVALVFIPLHMLAMLIGFEAYVTSLINLNYFLKHKHLSQWILPSELGLHALCALGIYLGRFARLNSWDLLIDPTSILAITLNTLTSKRPLAVIVVTFMILTIFYWVMKQVTLGLKLRVEYARKGLDVLS
ncbi:MAG: DUF1361 domain-containing protein [Leptolyngbyaceae cyanobacterium]